MSQPSEPTEWTEEDLFMWITMTSSYANGRRFLEDHSALVDSRSIASLELAMEDVADDLQGVEKLRAHVRIISDALGRGGDTRQSSRDAFVNIYGALAFDLPPWLERILDPAPEPPLAMTTEERISAVRAAIESVPSERLEGEQFIRADLRLLLMDLLDRLQSRESAHYDEAIQISQAVCASYPADTYPKQHAMGEFYLGKAFADHPYQPDYDGAIHAYTTGLACMAPDEDAELRAIAHTILARAYLNSPTMLPEEKIACGIAAAEAALDFYSEDAFPEEWATLQITLGNLYHERIAGGRGENIERAITIYQNALRVCTEETRPEDYAMIQLCLGDSLRERVEGHALANPETAKAAYVEALRIYDRDRYPEEHATARYGLGASWLKSQTFPTKFTSQSAIAEFRGALTVWTFEQHPERYAMVQNGLGLAYADAPDDPYSDIERAIASYRAALSVYSAERYPTDHAMVMGNLGNAYVKRKADLRTENLRKAIACFDVALRLYDRTAYPIHHRLHLLYEAFAMMELGDWEAAHQVYQAALAIEEQLLRHEIGEEARATMLREGRDAPIRDGYALAQLGRADDAVVIERGRARGLADVFMLDDAEPERISDADRRTRFIEARERYLSARAALFAGERPTTPLLSTLLGWFQSDRSSIRETEAPHAAAFQEALDALDAIVDEIRRAGDPGDFLQDGLNAAAMLRTAQACGPGHALVYLAATPWGGFAVGAFAANPQTGAGAHISTLNLPGLTHERLSDMTLTKWADGYPEMIGGFAHAQCASALHMMEVLLWTKGVLGASFRLRARAIHEGSQLAGKTSTLGDAAQRVLDAPDFREIVDRPFSGMDAASRNVLDATMNHCFLEEELRICLPKLASLAMQPLATWLTQKSATSVTLIPCGYLEAYPLSAVSLTDGRTFAETFATSVAPSARSLRFERPADFGRAGVYTFGDPSTSTNAADPLHWSEAEALTVARLARLRGLPRASFVQDDATRARLDDVITRAAVVDASCHGRFDLLNFLQSGIVLAGGQMLTLADLLSRPGRLKGLRLLVLSACQTAIPDVNRQTDEVRSIAAAAIQAGASAVLGTLWPVDDQAAFILIVRFMQEWLPVMDREPPAFALSRAQQWLRTATNRKLRAWHASALTEVASEDMEKAGVRSGYISPSGYTSTWKRATLATSGEKRQRRIRGGGTRYSVSSAEQKIHQFAESSSADEIPFAHPIYWAGFQITGW